MGGPVGGQPPQGRPGIAPRQGQAQPKGPGGPADKGQQSTKKGEKEGAKPDQKGQREAK